MLDEHITFWDIFASRVQSSMTSDGFVTEANFVFAAWLQSELVQHLLTDHWGACYMRSAWGCWGEDKGLASRECRFGNA